VVLSVDERSQIQAVDAPSRAYRSGRDGAGRSLMITSATAPPRCLRC
jgi:hypothetical protein